MSDVLEFAGVSVVRGQSTLLDDITWEVEEGQRWVVLGPNGAGKTTLLQLAAGRLHPTRGWPVCSPRCSGPSTSSSCGRASASRRPPLADRIPGDEAVHNVVVTASYGVVGRWREAYDNLDHVRAARAARGPRGRPPGGPALRHP